MSQFYSYPTKYLFYIFFFLCFFKTNANSQTFGDPEFYLIDSLDLSLVADYDREILDANLKDFHKNKLDSARLISIQIIVEAIWDEKIWPRYNQWILDYVEQQLTKPNLSSHEKKMYLQNKAKALNNKGFYFHESGDYKNSIYYYDQSIQLHIQLKDSLQVALLLNNLAGAYESMGMYEKNIDLNFKSLEIREALGDEIGVAQTANNIASIYDNLGKDSIALVYYRKSFALRKANNDYVGLSATTHNMSSLYFEKQDYDSAMYFSGLSIKYANQSNNLSGLAYAYNNLGIIYYKLEEYDSSSFYYERSLKQHQQINNKRGIAMAIINVASSYYRKWQRNGKTPITLLNKAYEMAKEGHDLALMLESPSTISNSSLTLSEICVAKNNAAEAVALLKLHYAMKDSMNNIHLKEVAFQKQTEYEFEKQKSINDLEHEKEIALEQANQKRQSIIIYFVFGGLITLIVFLYIIFKRLQITRKQNIEIERQKVEIEFQHQQLEESHKEIKDSITYAKRIQNAILPKIEQIQEYLPDSFVLYEPKDIVAGDFYWFQVHNNKIYIAVADCTGHGVPGAMVSVVCNNALNKSLKISGLETVSAILNQTREFVIADLDNNQGGDVKDGMDIALCCIEGNTLTYSGAHNSLYLMREGELLEFKADKQPIGKFEKATSFSEKRISIQMGDVFYLSSDGYMDQFGGEKGKKLKSKGFKELLIANYKKPFQQQLQILNTTLNNWRGSLEQNDDVCVIGFKIR